MGCGSVCRCWICRKGCPCGDLVRRLWFEVHGLAAGGLRWTDSGHVLLGMEAQESLIARLLMPLVPP